MKNFYIIANSSKNGIEDIVAKVCEYILSKGGKAVVDDPLENTENIGHTDIAKVPDDTECIVVLGGDGTLLRAANDLADSKVPFLGINVGTLGFLAAVDKKDVFSAIDSVICGDFIVENRMMIFGDVKKDGMIVEEPRALNEVVFTGVKPMQLLNLSVYVNGKLLHKYYADGLIISTPTGSTGYNLSAGGPIINPTALTMIMTPICPHSMHNRSIVFSAEDVLRIDVDCDRYGENQELLVLFDGLHPVRLNSGDSVIVRKSEKSTKIIKINEESFFETLHNKLKD